MTSELPGTADREGLELEFKRAEKLRTPEGRRDLVRTIVAMRNTEGGTIWIGCDEKDGTWRGFDPLEDGDQRHRDALRNLIVDAIEPLVDLGRSVRLERRSLPGGGWLLEIVVGKRSRGSPSCCARFGNQREFLRRVDDRNAVIPYSSLLESPTASRIQPERVLEVLQARCKAFGSKPCLAFLFVPEPERHDPGLLARLRDILVKPDPKLDPLSGRGWHAGEYASVTKKERRLQCGRPDVEEPYRVLRLEDDGVLFFYTHVFWLRSAKVTYADMAPYPGYPSPPPKGWLEEESVAPTIVSLARLAAKVSEEPQSSRVAVVASLRNATGWGLRIVGPSSIKPGTIESAAVTTEVLVRESEHLIEAPDAVASDLLRHLYSAVVDSPDRELRATDFPWFQEDGVFSPPR